MTRYQTLPLIRLESVSKRFTIPGSHVPFQAVDDVSLDVRASERFGIIGSSGAGKSTLLRLINLLEQPDAGRVQVGGRELTHLTRRQLRIARSGIGMIFQQFNLLQNATVHDNVAFPLTIQRPRRPRAEIDARVLECLAVVGLTEKRSSYPAQLSGGQKQRVAIARALATRPAMMLCDEPTSALDSETTRSVLAVLDDINRRLGVTLVVVTHELAVARTLCERVAVMADGRIVEDLALDRTGDRLETAIARANRRGGANGGAANAVVNAVVNDVAVNDAAVNDAAVNAAVNEIEPALAPPAHTVSRTSPTRPRRVGGLPVPQRSVHV